jgi:hypothetical protein
MEGDSDLTERINDTRHLENHPGTMNFKTRLEEAQRIHYHNMILASRLNNIQAHYKNDELSIFRPVPARSVSPRSAQRSKKTKFLREMEYTLRVAGGNLRTPRSGGGGGGGGSGRSAAEYDEFGNPRWSPTTHQMMMMKYNHVPEGDDFLRDDEDELQEEGDSRRGNNNVLNDSQLKSTNHHHLIHPRTILLEYTKVQDGSVLDIAVIKELYRDRYAIFGKDIESGQRYELRLTSEDVSNILDGDILVTSVDNVEVWMALLHKIHLKPVENFSRLNLNAASGDGSNSEEVLPERLVQQYTQTKSAVKAQQQHLHPHHQPHQKQMRIPSAPESYMRPSHGQHDHFDPSQNKSRNQNRSRGGRVIREKKTNSNNNTEETTTAVNTNTTVDVMKEIDNNNFTRVEEAAKARMKTLSTKDQQPDNHVAVPPLDFQSSLVKDDPAVDTHRTKDTDAANNSNKKKQISPRPVRDY